jgi:hypothetical protein
VNNHQLLKWFMESNRFTRKLVRWVFIFQQYDFDVKHWAKKINKAANGLSRNPNSNSWISLEHLAWGNKIGNIFWLACCFIPLHFGNGHQEVSCQVQIDSLSIPRIQRWNVMTLDLWIFLGI